MLVNYKAEKPKPIVHHHDMEPKPIDNISSFVAENRSFWTINTDKNTVATKYTLEGLRDRFQKIHDRQCPQDYEIAPNQLGFNFERGIAQCRKISENQSPEWQWFFDRHGWNQFCKIVLPSYGANFIEKTVGINPLDVKEDDLANMKHGIHQLAASVVMAHCTAYNKDLLFRTVRKPVGTYTNADGRQIQIVGQFIRAVLSTQYVPFSNLEFLNMLLDTLGNFSVYRLNLGDQGMTLKLIDIDQGKVEVGEEYPMLTVCNSEVGRKRAIIMASILKKLCGNGLTSHVVESRIESIHRGDPQKLRDKIRSGMVDVKDHQKQLLTDFNMAKAIHFQNGYKWISDYAAQSNISKTNIEQIVHNMDDPTSYDPTTLAGVVDGITLLAQSSDLDVFEQLQMEEFASRVLQHGLEVHNG